MALAQWDGLPAGLRGSVQFYTKTNGRVLERPRPVLKLGLPGAS